MKHESNGDGCHCQSRRIRMEVGASAVLIAILSIVSWTSSNLVTSRNDILVVLASGPPSYF